MRPEMFSRAFQDQLTFYRSLTTLENDTRYTLDFKDTASLYFDNEKTVLFLAKPGILNADKPVFNGSYDWHSSVHGHASLLRLSQAYQNFSATAAASGSPVIATEFAEKATSLQSYLRQRLTPTKLQEELQRLQAEPTYDSPYGHSWLLALTRQSQQALGTGDQASVSLENLSDFAAQRLSATFLRSKSITNDSLARERFFGFSTPDAKQDLDPKNPWKEDYYNQAFVGTALLRYYDTQPEKRAPLEAHAEALLRKLIASPKLLAAVAPINETDPTASKKDVYCFFSRTTNLLELAAETNNPQLLRDVVQAFQQSGRLPADGLRKLLIEQVGHGALKGPQLSRIATALSATHPELATAFSESATRNQLASLTEMPNALGRIKTALQDPESVLSKANPSTDPSAVAFKYFMHWTPQLALLSLFNEDGTMSNRTAATLQETTQQLQRTGAVTNTSLNTLLTPSFSAESTACSAAAPERAASRA